MNLIRQTPALLLVLVCTAGCAKVAIEGGDKPIHIIADVNVNVRVAHELDDFFSFEDKHPLPVTAPARATTPPTPI